MKKTFIAGLVLGLGLAMGSTAMAAEKTLGERHNGMFPKSINGYVTKNQCMQCHGQYEDLAKKTANITPNPHYSHLGKVNCEECHIKTKAQPELMCNTCHKFTLKKK